MKNWIPQKTFLVSIAGMTAVACFLYVTVLFLVLREIKKIENYYTDTESKYSVVERAKAIKVVVDNNKSAFDQLRNFFIKKGDEVRFIEEIEKVGKTSGLDLKISSIDVKTGNKETSKEREDIVVKMDVAGSWAETIKFLANLEKMNFGVLVQNFIIKNDDPGRWSGSMEILVFREK